VELGVFLDGWVLNTNAFNDVQAMQFGIPGYDGLVWDVSL